MAGLVTILMNPECPHCVRATDLMTDWCAELGLPVAGVDLPHHPEAASPWRIEHSPAVVFEREGAQPAIFTGFPNHEEFVAMTVGR